MKKLFKKTIVLIVAGILMIALPLEILAIVHNQKIMKKEAEMMLEYSVKSSAAELNMIFNGMDNLINMMQAIASSKFSGEIYRNDYSRYVESKRECCEIIENTLNNTDYISGLYITFNPDIYKNRQEIWYMHDKEGNVKYIDASPEEITPEWLPDDSAYEPDYYYDAVNDGEFWNGMNYDKTLGIYMSTHTRPVYDVNNELIGIVGADIYMDDIISIIRSMRIYGESRVALFGSELEPYASNADEQEQNKYLKELSDEIKKDGKSSGCLWYEADDGMSHIAVYTTLDNGWIFASSQPESSIMTNASEIRDMLVAAMIATIISIIFFVIFIVRRYYRSVAKTAEQNEIIVINQSRQAKLGEMMGSISHQCKQPLNSMSIDISNMIDDYNYNELTPENFSYYTDKLRGTISQMAQTIGDFSEFLKPDKSKVVFTIQSGITKVLAMLDESLRINGIKLKNNVPDSITVKGYPNEFVQCIFNILENARDAALKSEKDEKYIKITAERFSKDGRSFVRLNIFNTGDNIADDMRDMIFKAYFSTKEDMGGTGLGLYLTKQIIEDHFDGKIYFTNEINGVTFTVELTEEHNGNLE